MIDEQTQKRITTNIENIRACIAEACASANRSMDDVLLMAVSKTVGLEEVEVARQNNIHDFGENRTSELEKKFAAFPDDSWHFIGRIQTNKLKNVVGKAVLIHSVASVHALDAIEKEAKKKQVMQPVLLEVNVSGEESKDGFAPSEIDEALAHFEILTNVKACGFMTMAPLGELDVARRVFADLRELRDKYVQIYSNSDNVKLTELSMGMTQDYVQAICEGATIVRLGRSVFA